VIEDFPRSTFDFRDVEIVIVDQKDIYVAWLRFARNEGTEKNKPPKMTRCRRQSIDARQAVGQK
jgi:hypothetical protein